MPWTLTHDGITKTFAEWGLKGLKRSHVSQSQSVVSFEQSGAAFDGEPLFAIDSVVTISNDAGVWHTGPVILAPREATARSESLLYKVACPWWYLENLLYEQTVYTGAGVSATPTTNVVMFSDIVSGAVVSSNVEAVIASAVAQAVAAGASMQVAFAGDFNLTPPLQGMRDPMCAEVIRAALKWAPDATSGWDFSTTPPTLRIARRSAATVRTIDLADKQRVNLISITPRDDLRRERIVIQYETTVTVDEETYIAYSADVAGTGSPFRTLKATIPLSGPNKQHEKVWLQVAATNSASTAWWKRHVPHLKDAEDLDIHDEEEEPAEEGGATYNNEITGGSVPGWLQEEGEVSGPMRITAQADYKLTTEDGAEAEYKDDPLSVVLTCTSLAGGEYKRVVSDDPGESAPIGLAASFLAALGELQYDGQIRIRARECVFIARPGEVLALSNGATAWATAKIQVQKVDEDVDSGTTNITFGPPKHLSPQDIVEMMNTFRQRPPVNELKSRATAKKGDGNDVQGPRSTQGDNGSGGGNHWTKVISVNTDGTRKLTLSAEDGVKLEKDSGDASMDIQTGNQRIIWSDPSGDSMEVSLEGITVQNAAGKSVTLTVDGLTITDGAETTTLSLLQLLHDDGAGKTANLNEEQLVLSTATDTATHEAGSSHLSASGGKESTLTPAQLVLADGDNTNSLTEEQMVISGADKLGTYEADAMNVSGAGSEAGASAADGLLHTDGTDTAELNAVRMQIIQGGDSATVTPEGGLEVVSGGNSAAIDAVAGVQLAIGGGTVTITPVAGKDVSIMETEGCSDEGDPVTALVLRSLEVPV